MRTPRLEKTFLHLLGLSVLLHLAMYQVVGLLPPEKPKAAPQPTVVDMVDLPEPAKPKSQPKATKPKAEPVKPSKPKLEPPKLEPPKPPPLPKQEPPKPPPAPKPEPLKPVLLPKPALEPHARPAPPIPIIPRQTRLGDKTQRVEKEMAPKGDREVGHVTSQPPKPQPPSPPKAAPRPNVSEPAVRKAERGGMPLERGGTVPVARGEGLFKPKPKDGARQGAKEGVSRARLFPSGSHQARLEESYRMKYLKEVEEGKAMFLNTDDIRFASFGRRFSDAVYDIWRYPEQALRQRIDGATLVKITFKRDGEIANVELLESSGSKVLDDEVFRTLNKLGPVGPLPQHYKQDTLNVITLFHYSINGILTNY
jgi:periplasmic protein TonB